MTIKLTWQTLCAKERERRDNAIPEDWKIGDTTKFLGRNLLSIPNTCGILTDEEICITSDYDAVALVEAIRNETFSAEAVTTAFCKRAAIAQQLTNCLTQIFFEEAIENAKKLDQQRKKNPDLPLQPLHGLPISLKDSFCLVGKQSVIGMTYFVDKPATSDSSLVLLLRSLGAIFYCKTNVPQTMMTADSDNNVYGRTLNPNNTFLTAGGSTGGEGALIAMRGSILGVGTDIAGSIRIPSSCNGIYGFKPSSGIVPWSGQQSPDAPGTTGIIPSAGPMATSMRSCQFFLKAVLEADPNQYDFSLTRTHWFGTPDGSENPQRLRIGVLSDDSLHTPSPPMRRALRQSVQKLVAAGHTIVPIQFPDMSENMDLIWDLFSLDGSKFLVDLIESSGEPMVPSVVKTGLTTAPAKSIADYFRLNHTRHLVCKKFNDLWVKNNLDIILTLPAPHTALPFDEWLVVTYTAFWNLLDYPACVIPVGKVDETDVVDNLCQYGARDKEIGKQYTGPDVYFDAPTSIQLVGQRQTDEKLAAVAVVIDGIVNKQ